ncbi:MAG TPA: FHA domain-containing protein, partial [Candidatus Nanopelagicales bacterium]|nr:FHA domain-containing protein [Candidatus Nanopelagicales bacterium]
MDPRCIVEIRWGRLSGTKGVIPPGGALRVGRTERADLEVPHDAQLSALHFELQWDGRRCALRDLESGS